RGMGRGRGMGGRWASRTAGGTGFDPMQMGGPAPSKQEELAFLRQQAQAIQQQLEQIQSRISELEKEK
ncbi:MAG: hypothetical protein AMJ84_05910, partial [Acidithiobacillales bacterium SM23_46]